MSTETEVVNSITQAMSECQSRSITLIKRVNALEHKLKPVSRPFEQQLIDTPETEEESSCSPLCQDLSTISDRLSFVIDRLNEMFRLLDLE